MFERWAQDEEVTRYLIWKPHESIDESAQVTASFIDLWNSEQPDRSPYMIERTDEAGAVGMIDVRIHGSRVSMGFVLAREFWRQGLMSEVVGHVVERSFDREGVYRVQATTNVNNIGSQRVLEKAGMMREALLKSYIMHPNLGTQPSDVYMYGCTNIQESSVL